MGHRSGAELEREAERMIVVITYTEYNPRTGRKEIRASHGVDLDSDQAVVLPNEPPAELGAVFDADIGEFVIPDAPARDHPARRS